MTDSERLREDLAYVRAAVERQRQALCDAVPVWFAALAGGFFVLVALMRDLPLREAIGETAFDWINTFGTAILVAIVLSRAVRRRRQEGDSPPPRPDRIEQLRQAVPFLIFVAGVAFIKLYADSTGLDGVALQPIYMAYVAISFMLIGHRGLRLLFWMGAGLAVGTLGYVLLDIELKRTLLALGIGGGMVFGAWLDRRLLGVVAS